MSTRQKFNINNQGTVIKARERLQSQTGVGIAIFTVHMLLWLVLFLAVFVFLTAVDDLRNVLLYLIGLGGVFGLLFTGLAARRETRPGSVGEIDGAQTLGLVTVILSVLGFGLAILAFIRESSSSASGTIYLWGILWGTGLLLNLIYSIIIYFSIQSYRAAWNRTLANECRDRLLPSTIRGQAADLESPAPGNQPVWYGGDGSHSA